MGSRQEYKKDEVCRKDCLLKKTKNFFPSVVNSFEVKNTSKTVNIVRQCELNTQ